MTNTEAAAIVAILHGAYPGTYFDGAVAEVFTHSLLVTEYEAALTVANEWVATMDRFPTVADLNGGIRRHRQRAAGTNQLPQASVKIADKDEACEAFSRGYIRARTEAGEDMDTIREKLDRHLRAWKLHPATAGEPLERTGSGPKPTVPSRHQRGYLRSNTGPAVDKRAFDGSTNDEPW